MRERQRPRLGDTAQTSQGTGTSVTSCAKGTVAVFVKTPYLSVTWTENLTGEKMLGVRSASE